MRPALVRAAGVRLALSIGLAGAGVTVPACSSGEATEAQQEDVDADVRALADAMLADPARLPLSEVDEAIRDDRPVLAADLIAQGAVPATERQIENLRALALSSAEGRRLRSRGIRLYRARVEALQGMRAALSRGIGHEDDQLLEAMHADAEAQVALVAFQEELTHRVPELDEGPRIEGRGAPPRLPSRDGVELDEAPPAERPETPNPSAADPIAPPEPE